MNRVCIAIGTLIFLGASSLLALAAQGGQRFEGSWDGFGFGARNKVEWNVKKGDDGAISITATIRGQVKDKTKPKDKKPKTIETVVGMGTGKEVKLEGDKLQFQMEWSADSTVKGPADAKYVATATGNQMFIKWSNADSSGEYSAIKRVVVAKKDDTKKAPGARAYLSGLQVEKGIVTELAMVVVTAKASKAEYVKVTKDTRFIYVDGDVSKTFDRKSVLDDAEVKSALKERYITLERMGNVALSITFTPVKKK
jgi:hypothetical protein